MSILNKLAIKNLKLNKKRTISIIIGIALSAALICATATIFTSYQKTAYQSAIDNSGYYHLSLFNVNDNDIKEYKNNRDIKDIYATKTVGYSYYNSKNNKKHFFRLSSMDQKSFDNLRYKLVEGDFPKNNKEVAINKSIAEKVNYKIGDKIKLNVGDINEDISLYENNDIENAKEYEFNVVGFIETPHTVEAAGAVTTNENAGKNNVYISFKKPNDYKTSTCELLGIKSDELIVDNYSFMPKKTISGKEYIVNKSLLDNEIIDLNSDTTKEMIKIFAIVAGIIVLAGVFCIRNSFAVSACEKVKINGIMASIGSTKKQIKKSAMFEALILGAIGIPLGIIFSLLGVFVLLSVINAILKDGLFFDGNVIVFCTSFISIAISIVLSAITVYLSAISSARKASKVSPIENLKNSKDIKIKAKKLKTPKIIDKLFGIGGVLAYKNLKRSKKKYRVTVACIAISVATFIITSGFINNLSNLMKKDMYMTDYNVVVYAEDLSQEEYDKIINLEGVDDCFTENTLYPCNVLDKDKANDFTDQNGNTTKYSDINLIGLDNKDFKAYAEKIGANYEEIKSSGILFDSTGRIPERYYKYSKGENINIEVIKDENNSQNLNFNIGAITATKVDESANGIACLVFNMDEHKDIDFSKLNFIKTIFIKADHSDSVTEGIQDIRSDISYIDMDASTKFYKNCLLAFSIFAYSFIAVVTLIGITSIFNTITSNINLRQREFAVLKSTGMTKREFNRMVNLETIFYSIKSLIYGLTFGILIMLLINKLFVKINVVPSMPIMSILISILAVFILVFAIMRFSVKRISKNNIIETIRKDNI